MHKEIIIVGAGHYGLIAAHFLKKEKRDFLVLEQNDRVGDGWRKRFDSMTLFTPSYMAALPELPMELEPDVRPTKTQMGDYLDRYVDHFSLPVNTNHRVEEITLQDGVFHLKSSMGEFTCDVVIMAHGNIQRPEMPSWLEQMTIPKLQFRKYKSPISVKGKKVLVSGNGNSAAQIAGELTKYFDVTWTKEGASKTTALSILGKNRFWWSERLKQNDISDGKKNPLFMFDGLQQRLGKVKMQPQVKQAEGNKVTFGNGQVQEFDFIVYSDGYRPDFAILVIEGLETDVKLLNEHNGKSNIPNLFFLGIPYQRSRFPFQTKWQVKDVEQLLKEIKKGS
jgi:putative flavoprotein involved in K+ transport